MSNEIAPPPPPAPRSGCATAVMIIFGIILLLPGLCGLVGTFAWIPELGRNSDIAGFLVLSLMGVAVGIGGILLIRNAVRGRRT